MYVPEIFEEKRVAVLHDLIRQYPFGTLVTLNERGLEANHIPFLVESTPEPFGVLYAHVSRANSVWREVSSTSEVLAVFQGPQAYISPSWYVGRTETGMVVPTWNYAVVHAYGRLEAVQDAAWLRNVLDRLTNTHEAGQREPWSMSEAPAHYIDKQLTAIVGLKLTITRLLGKWKMSQNRPPQDRAGVTRTLLKQGTESSAAMAESIERANEDNKSRTK
jgi:transcriptional regulator